MYLVTVTVMKSIEDLQEFYNQELIQDLEAVEAKRKKIVKNIYIVIVVTPILIALTIGAIFWLRYTTGLILIPVLIYPAIAWMTISFFKSDKEFYYDFKNKVIQRIVKYVDPSLSYISTKHISYNHFIQSKLFAKSLNRFSGDDFVSGNVGNIKIELSEVLAEVKSSEVKSEDTKSEWHYVFRGIFFAAELDHQITSEVFILSDPSDSLYKKLKNKQLDMIRPSALKTGNTDFDNTFFCYSHDQDELNYILNKDLQQIILEFKEKTGCKIYISFIGNRVSVGIYHSNDLFEPRLFTTMLDFAMIKEYYEDIYHAIVIAQELDVRTRTLTHQA